jgi:hypothetical protein
MRKESFHAFSFKFMGHMNQLDHDLMVACTWNQGHPTYQAWAKLIHNLLVIKSHDLGAVKIYKF